MFRIDHPSAVAVEPAPKAAGTPGFFSAGDPASSTQATVLTEDWANLVQEELMSIVLDAGLTPDKSNSAQVLAAMKAILGTSPGKVEFYPGTSAPAGYIKANGSALSRSAYPALWAYAQASGNLAASDVAWTKGQFSPGDGATTFRIPDYRGEFPRFWDDGAGIDAARAIGSAQAAAFASHNHGVSDPGHAHGVSDPGHTHQTYADVSIGPSSLNSGALVTGVSRLGVTNPVADLTATTGVSVNSATTGISTTTSGGTETRPRNVALLACIKY